MKFQLRTTQPAIKYMPWKKLSSKQVYKSKWMEVTEDQVETETGKPLTYGVVHKEPFALIIPWDGTHFTLVGQYRYPVDYFSWEFPQGHLEHDTVYETALRELKEETGLKAESIEEIGSFHLAPGHHSQVCHVFFATKILKGDSEREQSEEDMETKEITLEELEKMINEGEIKDGSTIAAFSLLRLKKVL